jgi:hypothetical protein
MALSRSPEHWDAILPMMGCKLFTGILLRCRLSVSVDKVKVREGRSLYSDITVEKAVIELNAK